MIEYSQGVSCSEAAVSQKYISYLLESPSGNEALPEFLEELGGSYCVVPIGSNESIVYYENPNADGSFQGNFPYLGYHEIPKCYGLLSDSLLEDTGVRRVRDYPQLGLRGSGTLIGILDTGIDLRNPLFLYEDGTSKVVGLWDQGGEAAPDGFSGADATVPEGFQPFQPFFGKVWNRDAINLALESGASLPLDESGHGTFLAAVTAGREGEGPDAFSGIAPDASLLVVKLKQAKTYLRDFYSIPPGVWACQEDDLLLGIRYLISQAKVLRRPIAICIGVGSNLGDHEGNDMLSRYISSQNLISGLSFQIASGNEGIAGHHFMGTIAPETPFSPVDLHVGEGENGFILELWGSAGASFSVGFVSPGGEEIAKVSLKRDEFRTVSFFPEETTIAIRSFAGETVTGQPMIRMNFRKPSAGIWNIRVYGNATGDASFHLWLPLSNFLQPETRFLNATADVTLTSPANAAYGITYVPYDTETNSLYVRASRGYTASHHIKPDLAAPGVAISVPASNGRQDTRSGSSIAAACGTGLSALWLEWGIVRGNDLSMSGQQIRYRLIQGSTRSLPFRYPNESWGYGAVNLYDSFLSLREE